jgi:hypothetical protein
VLACFANFDLILPNPYSKIMYVYIVTCYRLCSKTKQTSLLAVFKILTKYKFRRVNIRVYIYSFHGASVQLKSLACT